MDNERWEPIPDAPGYHISDQGRLASALKGGWRILRPSANRDGYYSYPVPIGGVRKNSRIHRLVARVFLAEAPTPRHEINHRDGNKTNNSALNLEWVTKRVNQRHRFDAFGQAAPHGMQTRVSKLTDAQVVEIRARRATGEYFKDIAKDYGVTTMSVYRVCARLTWRHI